MKKHFTLLLVLLLCLKQSFALISITVTGNTNTVPALAASYVSLSSAISALNSVTTINGAVTFNMNSGGTESSSSQYLITQPGSFLYPITFQKTGSTANPKLTRTDVGTNVTTGNGGFGDGVIRIDGTDNIHFNGLDIAASNMGIEYGYYIHKPNAANGSQTLSIKNSTITMTKGTSAFVIGIYVDNGQTSLGVSDGLTLTAASGQHMNFTITGNTIQNVHKGIFCYGYFGNYLSPYYYDRDFTIGAIGAGNIIQNFGGGISSEAAGISCNYIINLHINYNTIANMAGGGVNHTSTLYGLDIYDATGYCDFKFNTITLNNTSGAAYWISNYTFGFSLQIPGKSIEISNNQFSGSVATSSGSYLIYSSVNGSGSHFTTRNNTTVGNITMSGSSGSLYGYYHGGNTSQYEEVIGNNFSNLTSPNSCYGIYSIGEANDTTIIDSNIVSNQTTTSTTAGTNIGIYSNSSTQTFIRNNTVFTLSGFSITAIRVYYFGNKPSTEILGNKMYGLNSSSTSTTNSVVNGIDISSIDQGGNIRVYNNLIGVLSAPASSATNAIAGIETFAGTLIDTLLIDIAHNTVYVNANSSTATNFGTSGIYQTTSSSASSLERFLLRNNIIVNKGIAKGTGLTTAFRRSPTNNSTYDARSNRNVFYVGTPSATKVVFTNGTNTHSTLNDYQNFLLSACPTAERNSYYEDISFQSLFGTDPNFLKFDNTVANVIESGGLSIPSVDGDYTNSPRAGELGYTGTGVAPDLGAWELEGVQLNPCSGAPALPSALISNANPCSDSLFSVYTNPIYGVGTTYQWQLSTVDSNSGFISIPDANESYYVTSAKSMTWYRCIVTCINGNQSITSTAVKANVMPLSGTYIISNTGSGNYNSIAAAITDLHCRNTSGPVIFEVVDGQIFTETINLSIRYNGNYPVTFKKQGSGTNPIIRRVGTSSTSNYILEILGADNIIFDGIDFEQTGTAASTWVDYGIHITNNGATNGAQHNTFKNGTITLSNLNINSIGVYCNSTAPEAVTFEGTNSYNRFVNMTVQNAIQGYRFNNTSNNMTDDGNEIVGENGLRGNINDIGNTTVSASAYGIYAVDQKNFNVNSIDIVGLQSNSVIYGIYSSGTDSSEQTFSNNHIQFLTSGSSVRGMTIYGLKKARIFNNELNELITTNTTTANVIGILNSSSTDSVFIYNNKIYNLSAAGTTTCYVHGLSLEASATNLVYNNLISDLRAGGSTRSPAGVAGVYTSDGLGGELKFYNNSIYLTNIGTNASYRSACLLSDDTTFIFDLRNNLMLNKSNVTTGSYAVGFLKYDHNPDKIATTCNNNIWHAGMPDSKHFIYYSSSTSAQTLPLYKALSTIAPAESQSFTENTSIIASLLGEIRPDISIPNLVEGRGQSIPFILSDFESDLRNPSTPDIGADEGSFTANLTADCPTLISPVNNMNEICPYEVIKLTWDLPASLRTVTGGYDVYFGTSTNPPFLANTPNLFYTLPAMNGNTTYYWKIVAKYSNGDAEGCTTRSFTTSSVGSTSVTNGQRCGPGVVNLSAAGLGTIQWFASLASTSPIQTGTSFSPTISSTTNYYVSSINGYGAYGYNVGKATLGTPSTASTSATEYQTFSAISACIIDSVVVYPSTTGTAVLQLTNSAGTVLQTASKVITASQIGVAVTMALNWPVPAGTAYRIYKPATSVALLRNTSGAVYPYTLAGVLSILSSSGGAAYYSWAYNWTVRAACESPKQLVTATVNSTTSGKVTVNSCNAYTWPLNGITYNASGIYTHTSIPASGCVRTDSLVLTIGVSGSNPPINVTACGSYTWGLSGMTYTSSGTYTATFLNQNGCDSSHQLNLTIQSCLSNLQGKLLLQGYYNGSGYMLPVLMNEGIGNDPNMVDFINVELRDTNTFSVVASSNVILQTNGTFSINFPVTPGYYYIVVKHRNTLETWSANPISFGSLATNYDFSLASNKAYGNNMIEVEPGYWALYTADLNSDQNIDLLDLAAIEVDVNNLLYGYFSTDLNGDGNIDLIDMPFIENNMANFISTARP